MATSNAKNRLQKKLEQLNAVREKEAELQDSVNQAKDSYYAELMMTLQKNLDTDDLEELEAFINSVKPLQQDTNSSQMNNSDFKEVHHGN